MASCPSCRAAVADDARFCAACGTSLGSAAATGPAVAASSASLHRRERRVVTSLFCDLVGFTSQSEAADPEDLDRMLDAYFALARAAIERHGGVVEKFIGDAVVGVFGVPVAHEDDPARAVRAGLAICEGASTLATASGDPLRLRVGINTGETFAHLDVDPESGDHVLVGDAVNTAARIQSAAPELGVAVGLATWESTNLAFDYLELEPASLKGKASPVRLFHARAERASRGIDPSRSHEGRYVGRTTELQRLRATFDEVAISRRPRLAVVAGEPGIGKSRFLGEVAAALRLAAPGLAWRQGRCLPYGDGTGFWALGEIVKTHAGILDGDDDATAIAKLQVTLDGVDDPDWLRERVLPLIGVGSGDGPPAGSEERFSAWARYLSSMAGGEEAVIALEDVHWADAALLEFIENLATADAPLLVLATTRPGVWDSAPGFASGDGVLRIDLQPLDGDETAALIVGLLGSVVPVELHARILRLSQGNPLFAQELVRLLGDRGLLERREGEIRLRDGATIPLPQSIHGLLAARLDALASEERSVIARASVLGGEFWPEAVAALGDDRPDQLAPVLERLVERELVRRADASSIGGADEYAFAHILVRDVAYGAQPRGVRLDRHLAAADWIRANGRREDVAGVVAHHLSTAHELAVATRDSRCADIRLATIDALIDAADNARGLDATAACTLYARALDLSHAEDDGRIGLLLAFGSAAMLAARHAEGIASLEEALDFYRRIGDDEGIVRTLVTLNPSLQAIQDRRWVTNPEEALRLAERLGPSALLVDALIARSGAALWDWSWRDSQIYAQRAIDTANAIGIPPPPRALAMLGRARLVLGEPGGLEACMGAVDAAVDAGRWDVATGILSFLAMDLVLHLGYAESEAATRRGIAMCDAHGIRSVGLLQRTNLVGILYDTGRFDEALALITQIYPAIEASGDVISAAYLAAWQGGIALIRGDADGAAATLDGIIAIVDAHPEQDDLNQARLVAAAILARIGHRDDALRLVRHVVGMSGLNVDMFVASITRLAIELGEPALADAAMAKVEWDNRVVSCNLLAARATMAEVRGNLDVAAETHRRAAEAWDALGDPYEAALSWLGSGRAMIAAGRASEATPSLVVARARCEFLGAMPMLGSVASLEAAGAVG